MFSWVLGLVLVIARSGSVYFFMRPIAIDLEGMELDVLMGVWFGAGNC